MPVDLTSRMQDFLIVGENSATAGVHCRTWRECRNIVEAKKEGPFISVEDLQERARISRAIIDILREHGCLDSLPESNQISLF